MADISKINGVDIGDIEKINGADKGDLEKFNTGEVPASQTDPSVSALTNYQFDSGDAKNGAMAYSPDDSTLGVAYCDGGNSSYPTVRLGTLSGTTITWGNETVCESASCGPMGLAYDTNVDRYVVAWQVSGSGNAPKVAGASVESGPVIGSLQTDSLSQVSGKGDGKTPEGNMLIYDPAGSRTLLYFGRSGSHNMDQDDIFPITFDDVGSDNSITINAATTVSNSGADYTQAMSLAYDASANKVVGIYQGRGSPYKVTAFVVSGTGTTVTANTGVEYANTSIMCHNGDSGGSSLNRHRADNSQLLVHVNGVNHCLLFDDSDDTYVLTGFTVSGTTPTWLVDSHQSKPIRSNDILNQFDAELSYGDDDDRDGGGEDEYATYGLFANSGRNRFALAGPEDKSDTGDMNVVGVEYAAATGYHFIGGYLELHSEQVHFNYGDVDINNDSWYSKHALITGQPIDDSGGYVLAFDPGVGQRATSGAIWSLSSATLSTARSRNGIGIGTSRIASMTGGGTNTSATKLVSTEEYNGSTITAGGNMATARMAPSGTGTLTAGLVLGGTTASGEVLTTEEYDGSSFSSGGTANVVGGEQAGMCGTQTSAIAAGGYVGSYATQIETYNGSSWSDTGADLDDGKGYLGAAGTSSDCIFFGGTGSGGGANRQRTEGWDGSSLTTLNSMSNGRNVFQSAGTRNDVVLTGGSRYSNNDGEVWNGTSWAASSTNGLSGADLYSSSDNVDCSGTSAAVFFGGGTATGYGDATNRIAHYDR